MIRCYLRGFIGELLSMAAIVLGLLASLYFYKNGGAFIREKFSMEIKILPEVIAFVSLFIIVFLAIKLIDILLNEVIEGVNLGGADRFLGIVFGLAEGLVVVSLILFLLRIQPLFDPTPILSESFFARLLLPLITGTEKLASV